MVEYWNIITRIEVQKHRRTHVFLFGDNLAKTGFGGQAGEMRGEPNAFGIPTKKVPSMKRHAFFSDKEYSQNVKAIDEAFDKIPKDKIIVIPKDGLGTGRARLPELAPKTYEYLCKKLSEL